MDTLKNHVAEVHKRKTNVQIDVVSPVKKHVSEAQGLKTPFHCPICDIHFVSDLILKTHMKIHKHKETNQSGGENEEKSCEKTTDDPCFSKLNKIMENILDLQKKVQEFHGGKKSKDYKILDEMLTKNLLSLDGIDIAGRDDVRNLRKECVKSINLCSSLLDSKAENQAKFDPAADMSEDEYPLPPPPVYNLTDYVNNQDLPPPPLPEHNLIDRATSQDLPLPSPPPPPPVQTEQITTPLLHDTQEEFLRCKYCNKKSLSETLGNYDTVVGERENSCLYALDGFLYAKNSTRPNKIFLK